MRMENSPEYEAQMAAYSKKIARKAKAAETEMDKVVVAGKGKTWTPMEDCPFAAFDLWTGSNDAILVTDGKLVTVARIHSRFGTTVFYKTEPEMVMRDGMMHMIGGEIDPRDDLPKWWWKWKISDELKSEDWAYGEPAGQPEVGFVATHWMFLPQPPNT